MKKIFLLTGALFIFIHSFAAFENKQAGVKACEIFLPIGDMRISFLDLSLINVKDFQRISGRHLNFIERLTFRAVQNKLRNNINDQGYINNSIAGIKEEAIPSKKFNTVGFLMGLVLGWIGVLLAYVIKDEAPVKKSRIKWAWLGFGAEILIALIIGLIVLGAALK